MSGMSTPILVDLGLPLIVGKIASWRYQWLFFTQFLVSIEIEFDTVIFIPVLVGRPGFW